MRAVLAVTLFAFVTNASAATPTRTCAQRADSNRSNPAEHRTPDDLVVGHRIMLVGLLAEKIRDTESGTAGWKWFKALSVVRRGRRVTISIPRSQRDRLRLNYGHSRTALTFAPCSDRR